MRCQYVIGQFRQFRAVSDIIWSRVVLIFIKWLVFKSFLCVYWITRLFFPLLNRILIRILYFVPNGCLNTILRYVLHYFCYWAFISILYLLLVVTVTLDEELNHVTYFAIFHWIDCVLPVCLGEGSDLYIIIHNPLDWGEAIGHCFYVE